MITPSALLRCVGEPDEFLRQAFGQEPHLHHGDSFDDLLSLADVDAALAGSGLRRPAVRLVRDGQVVDPALWTRRVRTGAVTIDDLVDPARVIDLYAGGATIVLQSLQRWWPPVARFCDDLQVTLTHAVQANAYLTGPGAVGLTPHHDTHDVFVLQLHGTKHWTVREPLVDAPLRRHRSEADRAGRQPVLFETDLRPGMCLYLPRGMIHSAKAQDGSSMHLTIGVLATTAADVVRQVARLAGDVPALRRNLPSGWAEDPATAERVVKEILDELSAFAASLDATAVASHMAHQFRSLRRPSSEGQLLNLELLTSLDDDTVVTRRDGIEVRAEHANGRVQLRLPDRTIEFPAELQAVIGRLLDGERRRVGDLADHLDGPSRFVLVRRLVREGLIRMDGADDG